MSASMHAMIFPMVPQVSGSNGPHNWSVRPAPALARQVLAQLAPDHLRAIAVVVCRLVQLGRLQACADIRAQFYRSRKVVGV